jgi:hypothetical protein
MESGWRRGNGFLVLNALRHPARYSINVPEDMSSACLTRGVVSSDEELLDAAKLAGFAVLELENGGSVKVMVTRHNLGSAEIRVQARTLLDA